MSNGKIAIITGATSGIGRATALALADRQFNLILTGRRADRLEQIKNELSQFSVDVDCYSFDVREFEACQQFAKEVIAKYNRIDLLVNNAGLAKGFSSIDEGQLDHWETMIDTNVKGLLYMTRVIAPIMKTIKSGQIINICSTAGKEVYPNGNVYCATKHAVDALTKSMRLDLYKYGIKVGQVCPGHVEETEFAKVRFDGNEEKAKIYEDFNPLTSSDVANAIVFLATQPPHVNIQDLLIMGTQQASSNFIDRSGRIYDN